MEALKAAIERLTPPGEVERDPNARQTFLDFRDALTQGKIRAAEKKGKDWFVNAWVKRGILLGFQLGELTEMGHGTGLSFVDKDTFPLRRFTVNDRVRVVPGGSSVRVGGNCGIYEGTLVRSRAVLGAGTVLTRSTPLYDMVRGQVYRATGDKSLEVPENAVVVPGARAVKMGQAAEWNLSLYTPVIVKYRDDKTDQRIELEDFLRKKQTAACQPHTKSNDRNIQSLLAAGGVKTKANLCNAL